MSVSTRKFRLHDTLATVDVTGWSARQGKAEERIERNRSERVQVIRRARAAAAALAAAKAKAQAEFEAMNRPVASPLPPMLHPDVAALVARFLAEKGLDGADLLRPLHGGVLLEEIVERHVAAAQAEFDLASAAVLALSDDDGLDPEQPMKAKPVLVAPADPVAELPVMPRRRGRPPKGIAAALEGAMDDDEA